MKIAVFIPTYNAIKNCRDIFLNTLNTLKTAREQNIINEILVIDSSSQDTTVEVVNSFNFEVNGILNESFDHGGTRQLAMLKLQSSDIIIYLTQDVLINNIDSLVKLITPIIENDSIVATYGRQLPHKHANLFAKHLRVFNYLNKSYVREYNDRFIWGMNCVFASDAFAAYKVSALNKIGGFPKHLIFGEDVYVFAKLLINGFKISYVSDAICYHSHNYSLKDEFCRYFDIGVFHRSENWIILEFGSINKRGFKFFFSELYYLRYHPFLFLQSFLRTFLKFIGYKLGYNFDILSIKLCKYFSMNKKFWGK